MRAVVTGSAGFIGSHLSERLIGDGWSVIGIDSFAPTYDTPGRRARAAELARTGAFEFIEGDINDLDLRQRLAECDVVFHLAARPGVRASWTDFGRAVDANVLATQRVLDAVAGSGATRLVFASSSSVYGSAPEFPTSEEALLEPISPYGVTKAACETLVQAYASQVGIEAVSLRYFTVYGPRQRSDMAFSRWIRSALRNEPLHVYGDGTAVRDFTFVADVVDATVSAGTCEIADHEIFNVAGGSPASLVHVIEIIEELVGASIRVEYLSAVRGDPKKTGGETTKLRDRTGWEPKWTLREGLAAQLDWLRQVPQFDREAQPWSGVHVETS